MCTANWELLLEYLRVLLTWPPLAFALAIIVLITFRQQIRLKIASISKARLGDREISFTEQAQTASVVEEPKLPGPHADAAPEPELAPGTGHQFSEEAKFLADGDTKALQQAMDWARAHPGETVEEYLRLSEHLQFERAFNLIFGSQVQALEFARTWGGPRLASELRPYLEMHIERAGSANQPTLDQFLKFPIGHNLLTRVGDDKVALTVRGGRFLEYIKNGYPQTWAGRRW